MAEGGETGRCVEVVEEGEEHWMTVESVVQTVSSDTHTQTHTHTLIRLTGSGGGRRRGDRKVCGGSGGGRGTLDDCRK